MRNRIILPALVLSFAILISGCATLMHGSKQIVEISSSPATANVFLDTVSVGSTPLTLKLKRKHDHLLKIQMTGYQPYSLIIMRKTDSWIAGNILFGGLVGLAVDAITGGMYKLTPNQINAVLKQDNTSFAAQKEGLFISVVLKPDQDWQKIGQLEKSDK